MYKIYKIEYIPTGEVVYIGRTKMSLKDRYKNHCYNNATMYAPIKKYGRKNFRIIQIDSADDAMIANEKECFWTLFEIKIGAKLYNKDIGNYHTNIETRKKISEANTGRYLSEEAKKKISEANTGRYLSEEAKKKISEAFIGRYIGAKSACAKKVRCLTTGKEFGCIKDAANYYGMKSAGNIPTVCNGNRKYAGKLPDGTKLKWEYV